MIRHFPSSFGAGRCFSAVAILATLSMIAKANPQQLSRPAVTTGPSYDDIQQVADRAYTAECGKGTPLELCDTNPNSDKHRERVKAYRTAISAILEHLRALNHNDPVNQPLVYLLAYDAEKADLPRRAYRWYCSCTETLSDAKVVSTAIPNIDEDGHEVSTKGACEEGELRLKPHVAPSAEPAAAEPSPKNVNYVTNDEDVWHFTADSRDVEDSPALAGPARNGDLDDRPRPAVAAPATADKGAEGASKKAAASLLEAVAAAKAEKQKEQAVALAAAKQAQADAKSEAQAEKAEKQHEEAAAKAAKKEAGAAAKAAKAEGSEETKRQKSTESGDKDSSKHKEKEP
jgi:hypothetical protein